MHLQEAVAVVTGGASGIGRATALELARAGSDVIVADLDRDGGAETVEHVEQLGQKSLFIEVDVSSRQAVEALIEQAISWQSHCDLFMSNAGMTSRGAPHEFSSEDWETILNVNLYASIWATRAVLPHMLERNTGHLVFVSSGAGLEGIGDNAPYSVSKFGLVGLAESVARYLRDTDVSVSVVLPGAIGQGNMWRSMRIAGAERMSPEDVERARREHRDETLGWPTPESMAATIVEGVQAGRFYIFQVGQGEHEDWAFKLMRKKWADPDAFVLGE